MAKTHGIVKEGVIILKRPTFLTIWLILMAVFTAWSLLTYIVGSASFVILGLPTWAPGVLAIAAKLKGATTVTGVDIESWCVENANENAVKNGITDIDFSTQTLEELSALQAAVIFANINRNVLMEHLSAYAKILTSDGILLLSGFHEEDAVILKDLAFQHGLKFDSRTEKDGWICLKFINS